MPIIVSHQLSMTSPDDPAYENRPSHSRLQQQQDVTEKMVAAITDPRKAVRGADGRLAGTVVEMGDG